MELRVRAVLAALVAGALGAAMLVLATAVGPAPAPVAAAAPAAPAPVDTAPVAAAPSPVAAPPTSRKSAAAKTTARKTPKSSDDVSDRCTNRIDYASDPRDNATINTIGETTGKCPTPLMSATDGTGGGKGAGYAGTCLDTGTCYDPAGSAPGEGLSDEDYHSQKDANGETYAEYCTRTGQSVSDCAAG